MTASVASAHMDFVHPPVPGQVHMHYGSVHNAHLLLPSIPTVEQPKPKPKPVKKRESASLYTAASKGNLQQLKDLLNENNDVNQDQPVTGLTVLHFAASRGHLEVVHCLCQDYGALTDVEDREGEVSNLGIVLIALYLIENQCINS